MQRHAVPHRCRAIPAGPRAAPGGAPTNDALGGGRQGRCVRREEPVRVRALYAAAVAQAAEGDRAGDALAVARYDHHLLLDYRVARPRGNANVYRLICVIKIYTKL